MLGLAIWLDPRSEAKPRILNSVHIPVAELSKRVHELPEKGQAIQIADVGEEALAAWSWLDSVGRPAKIVTGYRFGESAPSRLWRPNAFLEQCVSQVTPGRALDLACGSGRDAVFLASRGFEVTAIDHLPDALALGQDLERRYLEKAKPIQWVCEDLQNYEVVGQFDLITCFYYLDRTLLSRLASLLASEGTIILETFTSEHRAKYGKPRSEELVLKPSELLEFAKDLSVLSHEEGWHADRHTARLFAHWERGL